MFRKILFISVAGTLFAYWFYLRLFYPGSGKEVTVTLIQGIVKKREGQGSWSSVSSGEKVRAGTTIRTGVASAAVLTLDGKSHVELSQDSSLSVDEVSEERTSFTLHEGRLRAQVARYRNREVRVVAAGSGAEAIARDADFGVQAPGKGQMDVAAFRGSVTLRHGEKGFSLAEGTKAFLAPDMGEPLVGPIPSAILLKVAWPSEASAQKEVHLQGKVSRGAIVTVNGKKAIPNTEGEFSAKLGLPEGLSRVKVKATDVAGNQANAEGRILVDTTSPEVEAETTGIWK